MIVKIKSESKKGKSNRIIAKEYGIDRKTVAKYIKAVNIEEINTYDISNRGCSYLDPYKDEIKELYLQEKNITKVYKKFKSKGITLTYSTLRHYISKMNNKYIIKDIKNKGNYKK